MTLVTMAVLSTVNVPCGTALSAEQLAATILDPESADSYDPSAFSFFSDVEEELQHSFLSEMAIDLAAASALAKKYSSGYDLPLAQAA